MTWALWGCVLALWLLGGVGLLFALDGNSRHQNTGAAKRWRLAPRALRLVAAALWWLLVLYLLADWVDGRPRRWPRR